MPLPDIWLWGAGGHGRSLNEVIRASGYRLAGVIDPFTTQSQFCGAPVYPALPQDIAQSAVAAALGIGSNDRRAQVMEEITRLAPLATFPLLIHPSASVAADADLSPGTAVFQGAVVGAGTQTGAGCVINSMASVDHDGRLGAFASLAPGALLGGAVTLGDRAFVGMRATVLPGRRIGADVVIGACALVTRDLIAPGGYWGTPARLQKDSVAMDGFLAR